MGVVIVQSKSTAHIFRLFGALIALLLIMGLVLGLTHAFGSKPSASPYGGLAAVTAPAAAVSPPPTPTPVVAVQAVAPMIAVPDPAGLEKVAIQATPVDAGATAAIHQPPRVIPMGAPTEGAVIPAPQRAAAVSVAAVAPSNAGQDGPIASVPAAATPAPENTDDAGLVNINTASADTIDHILGAGHIGKTIVRHRPYRAIQDLVDHRVLKVGDFGKIRGKITVD